MDFYGRAVLVITKFTALQKTCSKSSFYYWIWFSRKKAKKNTLSETSYLLLVGSSRIQLSSASLIGILLEELLKAAQFFKGSWRIQLPSGFSGQNSSQFLKRILQYPFDKNASIILFESTYVWKHGVRTPREEIAFTARPKIQSQSQIFRYGRSIFCLPHRPNISDIFDLCLHWLSVVRVWKYPVLYLVCNQAWTYCLL